MCSRSNITDGTLQLYVVLRNIAQGGVALTVCRIFFSNQYVQTVFNAITLPIF